MSGVNSSGLGDSTYLESVLECSPDAIFDLDDDGYVVDVNQQACANLGSERDDLVSTCARTLVSPRSTIEVDADATVSGDPNRLSEVFENLIENAIEHGGQAVAIRIGLLDEGVFVEDDGRGIDVDDEARLFEIGYSTTDDGTGFGLGIVRDIVEAHDWTITVTESASGGARFEIRGVDLEERE